MPRTSARMHYKEFCGVVEVWWGMVVRERGLRSCASEHRDAQIFAYFC